MADSKKSKAEPKKDTTSIEPKNDEKDLVNQSVPTQSFVSSEAEKSKPNLAIYGIIVVIIVIIFGVVLLVGKNNKSSTHSISTDTWTGNGKTDKWSNAANWSNGVPKSNYSLIFNTSAKSSNFGSVISDNDLNGNTYNSIKFESGTKVSYDPFEVTGNILNVGSGGVILDSTNSINIAKLDIENAASITGETKTPANFTTSLDLNANALNISNSLVDLNSLSGSGNITINKEGFLSFNTSDTKNPNYTGNVSVLATGQITINPANKVLGKGSLAIANSGKLFFKLSNDTAFSNALTLGGSDAINGSPYVSATSDIQSTDPNDQLILTLSGPITLNNNAILNTSAPGNNLAPVQFVVLHKINSKYKLEQGTSSVNISQE